jgi:high-affinity iron transporter
MLGTALIVFREVLEAALIIGIVAAATRGIEGRGARLAWGVLLGLAGSCAVAFGAEAISSLAGGLGQEIFNASVLFVAVAMLAWHNLWMAKHGRELAANAREVGSAVRSGAKELSVLMVVVALAVLREGSEAVLFLYGVSLSGGSSAGQMAFGGFLGVAGGALVGGLLYAGLLRIPLHWFFRATSALVLFLAAGMAAQAARFLIQADILPGLAAPLWDTSHLVPNDSAVGSVLHGLVGYEAQPAGMQVVVFMIVLAAIAAGMAWVKRRDPASTP